MGVAFIAKDNPPLPGIYTSRATFNMGPWSRGLHQCNVTTFANKKSRKLHLVQNFKAFRSKHNYKKHTKITMEFYFPQIEQILEILRAPTK